MFESSYKILDCACMITHHMDYIYFQVQNNLNLLIGLCFYFILFNKKKNISNFGCLFIIFNSFSFAQHHINKDAKYWVSII